MSEYKRVVPLSEQLGAQWGIPGEWIEPHLAAAEECGRRRGVEEAAAIATGVGEGDSALIAKTIAKKIRAALAPRDSGNTQ